jgi:hypothetical protein
MSDTSASDNVTPQPVERVDKFVQFDDAPITDPAALQALYIPSPRNLVVVVGRVVQFDDHAIPAPDSTDNGSAQS